MYKEMSLKHLTCLNSKPLAQQYSDIEELIIHWTFNINKK